MSQNLFFGLPVPVALAFLALIFLLPALARVLAGWAAPVPVRDPRARQLEDGEGREGACRR